MPLVVPTEGELELLRKCILATAETEAYILKLYQNSYAPGPTTTATSFTEASFSNYAAVTLSRTSWGTPTLNGNIGQTSYAQQSWTCGATGNTIYGYYVLGATSGKVLWAEQFTRFSAAKAPTS
jgi:hypothetical protein